MYTIVHSSVEGVLLKMLKMCARSLLIVEIEDEKDTDQVCYMLPLTKAVQ